MNADQAGFIFMAIMIVLPLAVCLWFPFDEWREGRRRNAPSRDSVARARLDAIRASQRIGLAAWRASRALYNLGRDDRRDRNGR